jgi:hypothetical protein
VASNPSPTQTTTFVIIHNCSYTIVDEFHNHNSCILKSQCSSIIARIMLCVSSCGAHCPSLLRILQIMHHHNFIIERTHLVIDHRIRPIPHHPTLTKSIIKARIHENLIDLHLMPPLQQLMMHQTGYLNFYFKTRTAPVQTHTTSTQRE